MKDDSLNDVNPLQIAQDEMMKASEEFKGYYCPKCDRHMSAAVCSRCDTDSVGKTLRIRLPQDFAVIETKLPLVEQSVYEKEVWNAAIEAAANVAEINSAANIKKLRK